MKPRLVALILNFLGIADHGGRLRDLEKHFVTRRNPETGVAMETLADVPLAERKEKLGRTRGMNWPQVKQYLEKTDGGLHG